MSASILFPYGKVVCTPGVIELIGTGQLNPIHYLLRHLQGDWGELQSAHDRAENDYSVDKELRILSAYDTPAGRLWIITEADRSATTLILPDEY